VSCEVLQHRCDIIFIGEYNVYTVVRATSQANGESQIWRCQNHKTSWTDWQYLTHLHRQYHAACQNQWDRPSLIDRVSQRGETLPWRNSRYVETSFILVKIVTLFSYVVWPSAMKFGIVRGLANQHLLPKFGELWFRNSAKPCDDIHDQSFTDALVSVCFLFGIFLNYIDQNLRRESMVIAFLERCTQVTHSSTSCVRNYRKKTVISTSLLTYTWHYIKNIR